MPYPDFSRAKLRRDILHSASEIVDASRFKPLLSKLFTKLIRQGPAVSWFKQYIKSARPLRQQPNISQPFLLLRVTEQIPKDRNRHGDSACPGPIILRERRLYSWKASSWLWCHTCCSCVSIYCHDFFVLLSCGSHLARTWSLNYPSPRRELCINTVLPGLREKGCVLC